MKFRFIFLCRQSYYVVQAEFELRHSSGPPALALECWHHRYLSSPLAFFFNFLIFVVCVWVFRLHVCLCAMSVQYWRRPQEGAGALGRELQRVVSRHVGAGN